MEIITTVLEDELKKQLRQHGIVVWLDKDGHYTPYVDQLVERHAQGDFFAPVIPFRGSYLEMMLALENYGSGLDPERLLIHMPGHCYRWGKRLKKSSSQEFHGTLRRLQQPTTLQDHD